MGQTRRAPHLSDAARRRAFDRPSDRESGRVILRFLSDDRGATAIEYAVLAAMITVVLVAAIAAIGDSVIGMFTGLQAGFAGVN
ncbi:MAG: Flp family type IVb pilin [Terricaulis sp.]